MKGTVYLISKDQNSGKIHTREHKKASPKDGGRWGDPVGTAGTFAQAIAELTALQGIAGEDRIESIKISVKLKPKGGTHDKS